MLLRLQFAMCCCVVCGTLRCGTPMHASFPERSITMPMLTETIFGRRAHILVRWLLFIPRHGRRRAFGDLCPSGVMLHAAGSALA